jgi:hypothetical protein
MLSYCNDIEPLEPFENRKYVSTFIFINYTFCFNLENIAIASNNLSWIYIPGEAFLLH